MDSPFNLNRLSKIDEASLHFQKLMSKIIDSGKRGYIQKQNFLDDVSKIVDSIFNSDNKSNFEKYKELDRKSTRLNSSH